MTPFQAHELSIGHNWSHADRAEVVTFSDGASARFYWSDGAMASMWHDTAEEAWEHVEYLGYRALTPSKEPTP